MTKSIETGDLSKALTALQDLAKGHSSRGTNTTAVETMVGVSGSTQLFHTAANSDPGGWAGSTWRGEGWEDSISENGTDMGAPKALAKSIAKQVMAKLEKGQPLSARETNFVAKGGLNFLKDKEDADKAFPPKDDDDDKDVSKGGHPDAAEDKKQIESMVKPSAMKGKDVSKSLLDHASENDEVRKGFEVAQFLSGWAEVMHKSQQSSEARIVATVTDRLLTALARNHSETSEVNKSMADALASMGAVLTAHAQRLEQMEGTPARAPKSVGSISKSGVVPSPSENNPAGIEGMSKSQVAGILLDMVKKSEASAQDVLKYDATGHMSSDLARRVASRA